MVFLICTNLFIFSFHLVILLISSRQQCLNNSEYETVIPQLVSFDSCKCTETCNRYALRNHYSPEHCIFHVTDIFNTYMFVHQKITKWFECLPCDIGTKSMKVTVYGLCASSSRTIVQHHQLMLCYVLLDNGA